MKISAEVLRELISLGIDDIRTFAEDCSRENGTIYLYKKKMMGVYVVNIGLILEPIYLEVMRISNDLIRVGERNDDLVYYGGFSITTRSFVIPAIYTNREFWDEYKKYSSISQKNRHV